MASVKFMASCLINMTSVKLMVSCLIVLHVFICMDEYRLVVWLVTVPNRGRPISLSEPRGGPLQPGDSGNVRGQEGDVLTFLDHLL